MFCDKNSKLSITGFEFQGGICAQNLKIPLKRIPSALDSHPEKFSFFLKFLFLSKETPHFQKIRRFSCNAGSFLLSIVISYCHFEVIAFQFYLELNAAQSENSNLNCGRLRILLIFGKIIGYLCKIIVDLKSIIC